MVVGDTHVFPGFLTPVLTQISFPKPPTTFLTCFCRGERQKYAGKKVRLNWGSNSQPQGHESNTLTTEPPRQGPCSLVSSSSPSKCLYTPASIDRGHIVFALSVCPQKNLTLVITFECQVIQLSYFICGKTFLWYQGQGLLSRSNIKVTFFTKKLTLATTFEW